MLEILSKYYNLSDCALSLIRAAIIFGEFRLGEPLPGIKICDKFNLSQTPVSDTMVILKS